MAKKKRNKTECMIKASLLALSALIIIAMCFPALGHKNMDKSFSGFAAIFGYTIIDAKFLGVTAGTSEIDFSILGLVALALPLLGSVVSVFAKPKEIILKLIGLVCFLGGTVLIFLMPVYTSVTTKMSVIGSTTKVPDWTYQYGLMIAGVFGILGILICVYNLCKNRG